MAASGFRQAFIIESRAESKLEFTAAAVRQDILKPWPERRLWAWGRYWRCDKRRTSVNICTLSSTDRDIHELTSAIKYLSQTDVTGFHYSITGFAGASFARA